MYLTNSFSKKEIKNAWLTSFIDLVLIITSFFVMTYSLIFQKTLASTHSQSLEIPSIGSAFTKVINIDGENKKSIKFNDILIKKIITEHGYDFNFLITTDKTIIFIPKNYFINYISLMNNKNLLNFIGAILFNYGKVNILLTMVVNKNKPINDIEIKGNNSFQNLDFFPYKYLIKNLFLFIDYFKIEFLAKNFRLILETEEESNEKNQNYIKLIIPRY